MSSIPQIEELRRALDSASLKDVNHDNFIKRAREATSALEAYVNGLEDANHTYVTQNREMRGK
jgi:hypothetical protein